MSEIESSELWVWKRQLNVWHKYKYVQYSRIVGIKLSQKLMNARCAPHVAEFFLWPHDVKKIYAKRYENWELLSVFGKVKQCQKYKIDVKLITAISLVEKKNE